MGSLSAPSIHTYFAPREGLARVRTEESSGPVKRDVETPAGPQLKPLPLRTWFCSFLRLPAQTRVIGRVSWEILVMMSLTVRVMGFSTILEVSLGCGREKDPSIETFQESISSSRT